MKDYKFGINMEKYCREHEAAVLAALAAAEKERADSAAEQAAAPGVTEELLAEHHEKILMLQHERLIHLIVTAMSVVVELFAVYLVLVHPELGIGAALFMIAFAVLLGFYFRYYFFLENTTQRWYVLEDKLKEELRR